jgi:uncharacterized protein YdaU (DUF1376 family)
MAVSNRRPSFQFYPSDYLIDEKVTLLTLEQEGIYIRALSFCWREGSIPACPKKLAFMIGKGCTEEMARLVQGCFKVGDDQERLVHPRLQAEVQKQNEFYSKCSSAGRRSAKKRQESARILAASKLNVGCDLVETTFEAKSNSSSSSSSASSTSSIINTNTDTKVELTGKNDSIPDEASVTLTSKIKSSKKVFSPEGKKQYLKHVYLNREQALRVKKFYEAHGLSNADIHTGIQLLDNWLDKKTINRRDLLDDARAITGWVYKEVLDVKAKELKLQREESMTNGGWHKV